MMRIFSSHRVLLAFLCAALAFVAASLWGMDSALAEVRNPKGVAVIVGNKDYEHRDIPDVSFAHRDADAFKRYAVDVLGFDLKNIIDLRDARRRRMFDALGTERSPQGKLWSYLNPEGGSDVVVFYSGHGVPGMKDKRGYLLPVDGRPHAADRPPLQEPGESQGSAFGGGVCGRVFFGEQRRGEPDAFGESGLCARGAAEGTIEESDGADGGERQAVGLVG